MPMASSRNPPTASPENGHPSLMCLPRVMVHQLSSPAGSWLKDNGMHILKLDLAMLFNSHSQKSRKTEIVIRATSRRWCCIARPFIIVGFQPFQAGAFIRSLLQNSQFIIKSVFPMLLRFPEKAWIHYLGKTVSKLCTWMHPADLHPFSETVFNSPGIQLVRPKLTACWNCCPRNSYSQ